MSTKEAWREKQERYPVRITVRLSDHHKKRLEWEAAKRHMTVGDVVREILRKELDR